MWTDFNNAVYGNIIHTSEVNVSWSTAMRGFPLILTQSKFSEQRAIGELKKFNPRRTIGGIVSSFSANICIICHKAS
jgi:hypothetical protein